MGEGGRFRGRQAVLPRESREPAPDDKGSKNGSFVPLPPDAERMSRGWAIREWKSLPA